MRLRLSYLVNTAVCYYEAFHFLLTFRQTLHLMVASFLS